VKCQLLPTPSDDAVVTNRVVGSRWFFFADPGKALCIAVQCGKMLVHRACTVSVCSMIPMEWLARSGRLAPPLSAKPLSWKIIMTVSSTSHVVNDVICAKQAASVIGCSPWTVYQLCKARKLPHFHVGRLLRLRRSSLKAWLEEREAESIKRSA
jgi:excisionase family DNA binding protein